MLLRIIRVSGAYSIIDYSIEQTNVLLIFAISAAPLEKCILIMAGKKADAEIGTRRDIRPSLAKYI
jgi:hypothetical protein